MSSHLIEPGVKYFLSQSLKNCHIKKDVYYNTIFNISMFIFIVLLFSGLLYYMYKGKMTPEQKQMKKQEQYNYIMQKINTLRIEREKTQNNQKLITNLPVWEE